jgi:hypothetical protein
MFQLSEKSGDKIRKSVCRRESCLGRLILCGSSIVKECDVSFGCAVLRCGVLGVCTVIYETCSRFLGIVCWKEVDNSSLGDSPLSGADSLAICNNETLISIVNLSRLIPWSDD